MTSWFKKESPENTDVERVFCSVLGCLLCWEKLDDSVPLFLWVLRKKGIRVDFRAARLFIDVLDQRNVIKGLIIGLEISYVSIVEWKPSEDTSLHSNFIEIGCTTRRRAIGGERMYVRVSIARAEQTTQVHISDLNCNLGKSIDDSKMGRKETKTN